MNPPPVFSAALSKNVPLPVLLDVADTVSQLAEVVADHEHPAAVVTVPEADPPAAGSECEVGVTVNVQPAAAWVIATARPATVSVAVRAVVTVFAATL